MKRQVYLARIISISKNATALTSGRVVRGHIISLPNVSEPNLEKQWASSVFAQLIEGADRSTLKLVFVHFVEPPVEILSREFDLFEGHFIGRIKFISELDDVAPELVEDLGFLD